METDWQEMKTMVHQEKRQGTWWISMGGEGKGSRGMANNGGKRRGNELFLTQQRRKFEVIIARTLILPREYLVEWKLKID